MKFETRPRAKANPKPASSSRSKSAHFGIGANLAAITLLLVLPAVALYRRGVHLQWAGAYALAIGLFTYWSYARDKRRAQDGEWRISEARLHLLELLGGWPAAWLAQRRLRHKTSKRSYQVVFWLIVAAYQFAALDSIVDWKISGGGLKWITPKAELSR